MKRKRKCYANSFNALPSIVYLHLGKLMKCIKQLALFLSILLHPTNNDYVNIMSEQSQLGRRKIQTKIV